MRNRPSTKPQRRGGGDLDVQLHEGLQVPDLEVRLLRRVDGGSCLKPLRYIRYAPAHVLCWEFRSSKLTLAINAVEGVDKTLRFEDARI